MVDGHSPAGDYAFDKYNKVLRLLTLCLDANCGLLLCNT